MKIKELFETVISLKRPDNSKVKDWVKYMYEKYPANPLDSRQRCIVFGKGDDQQLGIFELKAVNKEDICDIYWFQAYPLRSGVGTKAMKVIQDEAKKAGIHLQLFPWDRGRISQANLKKFYRKLGFKSIRGGDDMMWRHDQ